MKNYNKTDAGNGCFHVFTDQSMHGNVLLIHSFLMAFLFVFIITSNLSMSIGILRTNKKLSISKKLFVCLSCSDLMSGLFTVPIQATAAFYGSSASCSLLALQAFFNVFPTSLSVFLLLHISFARYCSVKTSTSNSKGKTQKQIWRYLLVLEIVAPFAFAMWYTLHISQTLNNRFQGAFLIFVSVFCITMISCTLFLNIQLLATLNGYRQATKMSISKEKTRRCQRKVTKTILMLSVSLVICYLPTIVSFAIAAFFVFAKNEKMSYYHHLIPWSFIPLVCNSGLNSLIYICRNKKLKTFLKHCCRIRSHPNIIVTGGFNSSPFTSRSRSVRRIPSAASLLSPNNSPTGTIPAFTLSNPSRFLNLSATSLQDK